MSVIKVFGDRIEAEIVRSLLEANGINSQILADDQGGLRPALAFSGGVKLIVSDADAERALKIIEESKENE